LQTSRCSCSRWRLFDGFGAFYCAHNNRRRRTLQKNINVQLDGRSTACQSSSRSQ